MDHINRMLASEGQILASLEPLARSLKDHAGASSLLGRLRTLSGDHIEALRVRMLGIGVPGPGPVLATGFSTMLPLGTDEPLSASAALQLLYTLLSHAAFGYSVLHVVAHRQCDSGWGIEEGNTADIAEEHLKDYTRTIEILNVLISDVAVWELSRAGFECRCVCPSCGLGICMCGTHGTATVIEAWRALLTPEGDPKENGLSVLSPPRSDSVALEAGLERGDAIVGVDNQPVGTSADISENITDYQKALRRHGSGEEMQLKVRRATGEVQDLRIANLGPSPSTQERRLAAIMFTDMVGFTALAQKDEQRALKLLEEHRALVRKAYPRFKGREIKTMGDAFLLEFASALEAAACAIEIQRAVRQRNRGQRRERIQLRIGIHVGDLISVGGDIFGDAVNIASRIEPMADPGGICVTQQVYDQVWNKVPAKLNELAKTRLKNVATPVGVYRVSVPK